MNHKITAAFAVICVVSSVLSGCSIKIGEVTDEKTMISQPENITADITVNTPDLRHRAPQSIRAILYRNGNLKLRLIKPHLQIIPFPQISTERKKIL